MCGRAGRVALAAVLGSAWWAEPAAAVQDDRLYGRVRTEDGEVLEGYLRWDRNEAGWSDFLDGAKRLPREHLLEAERLDEEYARRRALERSIVVGGLRLSWEEDADDELPTSTARVRFGHLTRIEKVDGARVRLHLESGARQEWVAAGSDLGGGFRGLVVERPGREPVELRWRELAAVDLAAPPEGTPPPAAERLHGTLRTQSGREVTGYVAWDLDEVLTSDVLDGEADGGDRTVPFGAIARIEREDRRSARVVLRTGEVLVLRGTNDVNASNRGIEVSDPTSGRLLATWDAFASVRFHPRPGAPPSYHDFDGGGPLRGVVETTTGTTLEGTIRWDNDEAQTWETLDGYWGDAQVAVELAHVREVVRLEGRVRVTLRDGRTLSLAGSEDVGPDNRGLFVTTGEGGTVLVRWRELRRLVLEP